MWDAFNKFFGSMDKMFSDAEKELKKQMEAPSDGSQKVTVTQETLPDGTFRTTKTVVKGHFTSMQQSFPLSSEAAKELQKGIEDAKAGRIEPLNLDNLENIAIHNQAIDMAMRAIGFQDGDESFDAAARKRIGMQGWHYPSIMAIAKLKRKL